MTSTIERPKSKDAKPLIPFGQYEDIPDRKIKEETCQKFGYFIGTTERGNEVQVAQYRNKAGQIVAQKVRGAGKKFRTTGDFEEVTLFGQHLWRNGGKRIAVVEGEIDALSLAQCLGTWPVVSVPNGAQGAKKAIQRNIEFLESYETVVFMFDMDEPGEKAAAECAEILTPGKAAIASLPLKDANEMLKAGRVKELTTAFWEAQVKRPDGIVSFGDLRDEALKPITIGDPWPWESLTKATYGRRDGEVYALGAGTGVGKTDVFTQIIAHDALVLNRKCGVIYLEQGNVETSKRIAGKVAGKRFHIPDDSWTKEELIDAFDKIGSTGNVVLYDHFGASDWEVIKSRIRFMVVGLGVKHIFLDHLTALAAGADDERVALEGIMAEMAGMAQELKFKLHFISHLATPEGKPHEEGGRVMIRHFKGSRAIGFWSHFMFGLERNQQDDDEDERKVTTLRILKDRNTGNSTGKTIRLRYSEDAGMLSEDTGFDNHEDTEAEDAPF